MRLGGGAGPGGIPRPVLDKYLGHGIGEESVVRTLLRPLRRAQRGAGEPRAAAGACRRADRAGDGGRRRDRAELPALSRLGGRGGGRRARAVPARADHRGGRGRAGADPGGRRDRRGTAGGRRGVRRGGGVRAAVFGARRRGRAGRVPPGAAAGRAVALLRARAQQGPGVRAGPGRRGSPLAAADGRLPRQQADPGGHRAGVHGRGVPRVPVSGRRQVLPGRAADPRRGQAPWVTVLSRVRVRDRAAAACAGRGRPRTRGSPRSAPGTPRGTPASGCRTARPARAR